MGSDFGSEVACISSRDPPVMANTPHSGPLVVEYEECLTSDGEDSDDGRMTFTGGSVSFFNSERKTEFAAGGKTCLFECA